MTIRIVAYWLITAFLVFNLLAGGLAELAGMEPNAEGMRLLGYPVYVMTILGAWKVLGSAALLAPRLPRLKEWAYAGIFFNMTGAAFSHVMSGDAAWHVVYTGTLAALTLVSWALRPQSRTLGALDLFPARSAAPTVAPSRLAGAPAQG